MSEQLHAELKKCINVVIPDKRLNSLESVQAMLVIAWYSTEPLIYLSLATRMTLDLNLDEAFVSLTGQIASRDAEDDNTACDSVIREESSLMRQARTWLGNLVLEHM